MEATVGPKPVTSRELTLPTFVTVSRPLSGKKGCSDALTSRALTCLRQTTMGRPSERNANASIPFGSVKLARVRISLSIRASSVRELPGKIVRDEWHPHEPALHEKRFEHDNRVGHWN